MEKLVFNQFINNIPQVLWWKDKDSVFLGCNDNLAKVAGLTNRAQIIGKTDYDLPWSREESDFFRKIDKEVMTSGVSQLNFEESLTLESGEKRWLSTSKIPLYDENKSIIGIMGWYLDITAQKNMKIQINESNKALIEYNSQLEASNKSLELVNLDLEKFTYAVSHDLKAPLKNMMSFAHLLQNQKKEYLDEEAINFIQFIIGAGKRMQDLISDVLNYAKTGTRELNAKKANLPDLVNKKLLDLEQVINAKSAIVNLDLPSNEMNCYPHLIGLIFYNLINNAIKFNNSEIPTVDCYYTETVDHWIFIVKDNGIGIEPEHAEKVFEPFKRLMGNKFIGSGIGLSICKRVANIHNGKIWIENNPNGGTIFHFSISKHIV